MTEITFALGIPHAPWIPGREESYARLLAQVVGPWIGEIFDEKAPNHVWSEEMWEWGAAQDTTHFITLQDDAVVCNGFWKALKSTVPQHRDEVIGLHVAHPHAAVLREEGYSWCTTSDAIVGVAYCMPVTLLKEFLAWRATLPPGAVEAINEDTLVGLWCLVTGRKVYHPLPALVDHDTTLPSTYNNDGHAHRKSACFSADAAMFDYVSLATPRHLGRMWDGMLALVEKWVPGITPEHLALMRADDGRAEKRRLAHVRRGQVKELTHVPKLLICTPTRGLVHPEYAASVWRLLRDESYEVDVAWELSDVQAWGSDVVRMRSRMVAYFLQRTDATHLLFVDSDVSFTGEAVRGMLATAKDFVACPYPRRDTVDLEKVRQVQHVPVEAAAYRYSVRMLPTSDIESNGALEVEGVPLGCALLTRNMLARMSEKYAADTYQDTLPGGSIVDTVALFQLRLGHGALLSEDYSFCVRWREMGEKVFLYLGRGSPVSHMGEHSYHGVPESFGYRRVTT